MNIKKRAVAGRIIAVLALIIALCVCGQAESYEAGAMRLLRYEGSVEIFDPSGQSRFVLENVRFSSGEAMQTGEDGMASVSLDDSKIVTLDKQTRVEFIQESNQLQLNLTEGTLFLDVQRKLDENESLNIQTATMTVGIRGTIIFISDTGSGTGGNGLKRMTRLGVLEGTTQIDYTDSTGARRRLEVPAGQMVSIPHPAAQEMGVSPVLTALTHEDIKGFVLEQVIGDDTRTQRVTDGSEGGAQILNTGADSDEGLIARDAYPADGDWKCEDTVTLVAQSASKLYDGQTLTRHGGVLVYGLPEGFDIQVAANGGQTDAGESENPIAHYSIYNAAREDVTEHFTHIETVSGRLTVDPAPLTVWTGSAEKYYDGEPLTNPEAELRTAPGYVQGEPVWRNASIVTRTTLGSETMIALSGSTLVHGTNPLTGETREIVLYAGQRLSVCLHSDDGKESIEFQIETLTVDKLPDEILRVYADNPELAAQACADAKWDPELLATRIAGLSEAEEDNVVQNGLYVPKSAGDDLMIDSSNVRITIDTEITNYNSRPLTGKEAHFTPISIDPSIVITATGSQTEPGESPNIYEISWGGANPDNYALREDLGTLTVFPVYDDAVTFTANSAEKVYDGTPLSDGGVSVSGLPEGYTFTASAEGSLTDAGTLSNTVSSYQILNAEGEDALPQFPNIRTASGTLTVTPAPLTITTGSASKVYDGKPLTAEDAAIAGLVAGETAAVSAAGSITDAGSADNTYTIEWGTAKAGNYTVESEQLGTLTMEPLEIDIDCGGAETVYSGGTFVPEPVLTYLNGEHAGETLTGMRLRAGGMLFRFSLFTGETLDLTITGMGTRPGTYTLEGSVRTSAGNDADYSLSFTGITLIIEPRALTVTTPSAGKLYDGTPLTASPAVVTGLADGEEITVTCTGSITEPGTAQNTYTIDWGAANRDDYTITDTLGTLEVTANDAPVTLTAASASKAYDGLPLTAAGVTAEGLPEGFTVDATAAGSQTAVGIGENTVSAYTIRNADGEDVTASFTNVSIAKGTLEVTANDTPVTLTAATASKTYDGTALTATEVTAEGLPTGFTVEATATGSQTDAGAGANAVADGYAIKNAADKDVTANFTNITTVSGTLTVSKAAATIKTGSASKAYDGTALTSGEASITGLVTGETATITATGEQTEVGTSDNTYTANWGSTNKDNYEITEELGTLEVTENDTPVTLTAATASKTYDGTALTAAEVTAEGLPTGFTVEATAAGTQTDAGSCTNAVADGYVIKNAADEDVTSYFTNITTISGTLTVSKAAATIKTGSASKAYDGTALTVNEASITGLVAGESATITATGEQTEVGTGDNTYTADWGSTNKDNYEITEELGTLEVTKNDTPVTLTAPTASKTYDGTALTATEVTAEGLPTGFTVEATAAGSLTDAGTAVNAIADGYVIKNAADEDVTSYFTNITTVSGTLTVSKAAATIKTGSASKTYDGTALTSGEASITGLVAGETATVTATGEQTEVGTSDNTYTADWGSTNKDNYEITEELGTLEVTKNDTPITLTAATASKTYDGTALTAAEVTAEGLPTGFTVEATAAGSRTDAGTVANAVADGYAIKNAADEDVTSYFTNITTVDGTLTVSKAAATIKTGSASKAYDGTALTVGEASITGLVSGESATITATGEQTEVGTSDNTYTAEWGSTNKDNYEITEELGTLEVTENNTPITLTAATAGKTYDGTALTATEVTAEGLPTGFTLEATAVGSQTDAGTGANAVADGYAIKNAADEDVTSYFTNVTTVSGTLTVSKAAATIKTGSASKVYDGTALTVNEASITGLVSGETATITATGEQTEVGASDNTYDIDWGTTNKDNYEITEELGTLEVTENNTPIILTAATASKTYDGTALTATEVTAEGLPSGFTVEATATGSQTDAGTRANAVADGYAIKNAADEDVTSYFTNITTVSGTLTVDKAAATIKTGSASKAYDGTALTSGEASITGLVAGETATVTATGEQTEVGTSDNTYTANWGSTNKDNYEITEELGTLEVTKNGTPITLKAATASKTYDGTALTATEVTAEGLPSGFTVEATAAGSLTDAGTAVNAVADGYAIKNAADEDVTAYFTNITTVSGTLTVSKATATVKTGSASKAYDGTALTSGEASITGLAAGETATVTATGEQTEVGTSDNTYTADWGSTNKDNYEITEELGTLEVTENDTPVTLTAATASKTYDGTALTATEVTAEGLPTGFTVEATATGSLTDAGSCANAVADGYAIKNAADEDVTANFTNITTVSGTLTVSKAAATIKTGSASKAYDGTALTGGEASITGLVAGETATVTATGSQTDVGESTNTYTVDWGSTDSANYILKEELGTLTVEKAPVTVTTGSADKVYDGEELTCDEVSVTGLAAGETAAVTATGAITDAGTAENTYTIDWGTTNSGNYEVTETLGTLEVEPLAIAFDMCGDYYDGWSDESGPVVYDGFMWFVGFADGGEEVGGVTVVYTNGAHSGEDVELTACEYTDDGDGYTSGATAVFSLVGGGEMKATICGYSDAGTHDLTPGIEFTAGNADNYALTYTNTAMTIAPRQVKLLLGGAGEAEIPVYNGMPVNGALRGIDTIDYGWSGYAIEQTDDENWRVTWDCGDAFDVYVTGGGTDAGTYTLSCEHSFAAGSASNYAVSVEGADMTIAPAPLTVVTGSAVKFYDGTTLTNEEASLDGLIEGEAATVTATGAQTEIGKSDNTYTIDWGETNAANYEIIEELGELEVIDGNIPITITAGSDERDYDGTALTCGEATVEGLPDGFTCTVETSGSQTDAGESPNAVGAYTITDPNGNDVTDAFTNVTTAEGTLKVTPAALTITTESADRVFNGTALTAPAHITGLSAADAEKVTLTATGTITDAGTVENGYTIDWGDVDMSNYSGVTEEIGTLRVQRQHFHVTVFARDSDHGSPYDQTLPYKGNTYRLSNSWYQTDDDGNRCDGGYTYGFTQAWDHFDGKYYMEWGDNFILHSTGGGRHVGEYPSACSVEFTTDSNPDNYVFEFDCKTLTIVPVPLTVKTESATKPYDGTPLTAEASLEGLVGTDIDSLDRVTVTATGSQTEIGSSVNTYVIDWGTGSTKADDYILSEDLGELTVTTGEVKITAESASKPYDSTPLTAPVTITGLSEEDAAKVTLTATGTITDAGTAENGYTIDWGDVDTSKYNVTEEPGMLTVEKRYYRVSALAEDADNNLVLDEAPYNGEDYLAQCSFIWDYDNTSTDEFTVGYNRIDAHNVVHTVNWVWGDSITFHVTGGGRDVGEYPATCEVEVTSGNPANYDIETICYTLTITPAPITVRTVSASKVYDGILEPVVTDAPVIEGTLYDEGIYANGTGEICDVGEAPNTYEMEWGDANPDNYEVTDELGTLTVTPATLTVTTGDAEKTYDGEPLTCDTYTIDGLVGDETVIVSVTGSRTDPGSGENTFTVSWDGTAKQKNYTLVSHCGTLTVLEAEIEFEPAPDAPMTADVPFTAEADPDPPEDTGGGSGPDDEAEPPGNDGTADDGGGKEAIADPDPPEASDVGVKAGPDASGDKPDGTGGAAEAQGKPADGGGAAADPPGAGS